LGAPTTFFLQSKVRFQTLNGGGKTKVLWFFPLPGPSSMEDRRDKSTLLHDQRRWFVACAETQQPKITDNYVHFSAHTEAFAP